MAVNGKDSNDCTSPRTACLTFAHIVSLRTFCLATPATLLPGVYSLSPTIAVVGYWLAIVSDTQDPNSTTLAFKQQQQQQQQEKRKDGVDLHENEEGTPLFLVGESSFLLIAAVSLLHNGSSSGPFFSVTNGGNVTLEYVIVIGFEIPKPDNNNKNKNKETIKEFSSETAARIATDKWWEREKQREKGRKEKEKMKRGGNWKEKHLSSSSPSADDARYPFVAISSRSCFGLLHSGVAYTSFAENVSFASFVDGPAAVYVWNTTVEYFASYAAYGAFVYAPDFPSQPSTAYNITVLDTNITDARLYRLVQGGLFFVAGTDSTHFSISGTNISTVLIDRSTDTDIPGVEGGIVYVYGANNTIFTLLNSNVSDVTINGDNSVDGGVVYVAYAAGNLSVHNCNFSRVFSAQNGGAFYLNMPTGPTAGLQFVNCSFLSLAASIRGGALYIRTVNVSFTSCTFYNNTANITYDPTQPQAMPLSDGADVYHRNDDGTATLQLDDSSCTGSLGHTVVLYPYYVDDIALCNDDNNTRIQCSDVNATNSPFFPCGGVCVLQSDNTTCADGCDTRKTTTLRFGKCFIPVNEPKKKKNYAFMVIFLIFVTGVAIAIVITCGIYIYQEVQRSGFGHVKSHKMAKQQQQQQQ